MHMHAVNAGAGSSSRYGLFRKGNTMMRASLAVVWAVLLAGSAAAQTTANPYAGGAVSGDSSASYMWGTAGSGAVPGAKDSATLHALNGTAAAQVNAARRGYLLPDNITVQSIGSQSIVNVSVNGNNNAVDVSASQSSSNSGSVINSGVITNN
jgi:VCBS repeat-containing protein